MSFEPEITPPEHNKKAVFRKIKWQEDARDWLELGTIKTSKAVIELFKNFFN